MILIILYKAVNGHNISEHVMALAVYLLEMAVITAEPPDRSVSNSLDKIIFLSCFKQLIFFIYNLFCIIKK